MLTALGDLTSPGSDTLLAEDAERQTLVVTLSAEEHRTLKVLAARQGLTMAELARQALRVAGLLRIGSQD